ncbi:MAG TPA: Fic family protein [Candidatus Sulfotelmatobacter sp.]|nr:Fic family protein [Candidatus Sulfotelmatobacter sp.]
MYKPRYSITNKILKNIGNIEASKEVIDHAPLLPYFEKEFREDALVRSVHYGTHIEGNELNLNEAEKVIKGQEIVARDRDIKEVINYRKVIDYIGKSQVRSSKLEVSEETIKELHTLTVSKILPDEQCGVFRKTQVVVKNSLTGEVSFRPPMAVAITFQVKNLLEFINSEEEIHPVIKSGVVHYELVRIHPFLDGNGRVARAFATLILYKDGYDIRRFFSLEEYFDKNAAEYYKALQSVEKNEGDLTDWLEYFTFGLSVELSKIREKIESISIDAKLKEKLGGEPILLTPRQIKIIEYIQKVGYLQNQAFEGLFPMVSEDTILNELKGLVKSGLIKKRGVTKGAKYLMN